MFYKFFDKKRKRFKGRKRNKILADKGSELYNSSMKSWLQKMTQICIQHILKKYMFLLGDLLDL